MYLKLSLLVAIAIGACLCTNVDFNALNCKSELPPKNGHLECRKQGSKTTLCLLECDPGFDTVYMTEGLFICHDNGTWALKDGLPFIRWADCILRRPGMPMP